MSEPKPLRLATPHSCGRSCSRQRESGCGHPCPLQCHPGPCPPCQITTRPHCYCPSKQVLAFRCGIDAGRDLSCGNICRRKLSCGKHSCERVCHSGECDKCHVNDMARCWCGKEEREIRCGEGDEKECFVVGQPPWMGRFSCDEPCERYAFICFAAWFPITVTIDFSIAEFTNVKNHVIHHHPHLATVLILHPISPIVHVGKAPSRQISLWTPLSTHFHLAPNVLLQFLHATPSVRNPTLHVLIHAKPNAT